MPFKRKATQAGFVFAAVCPTRTRRSMPPTRQLFQCGGRPSGSSWDSDGRQWHPAKRPSLIQSITTVVGGNDNCEQILHCQTSEIACVNDETSPSFTMKHGFFSLPHGFD